MSTAKGRSRTEGRFSVTVLAPVLSFIGAAACVLGFVLWSANGTDERSVARQTELAHHVIQTELATLPRDQESVTIWDDAIYRTKVVLDRGWMDSNLGIWMHDYFGLDDVLVLDDQNQPIYAMHEGKRVDHHEFALRNLAQIIALVAAVRRQVANGGIEAYNDGTAEHPPRVTQLQNLSGVPSMVSLVPIISDSGTVPQEKGTEYIHIAFVHLDDDFAARIRDRYKIDGAAFQRAAASVQHGAAIPLADPAGRFMSFFQWTPSLPGRDLLAQTLPVIGTAFLLGAIVTSILSHLLWRKSRALELGRADAEYRAAHDQLTDLPNRTTFESILGRVLTQRPTRDSRASVLMLDLDRFKQVNDTLGHRAGDDLIRAVGQRLGQLLGPQDTLARLGGDEFAIIHIHAPGLAGPFDLSRKIIDAIGKPFDIFGSEAFVGVSIGIATAEGGEADPHELARKADIALYEAKASGRNRAVVFEEAMNEFLQNRKTIEAELRDALKRDDQLAVAFQPLYSGDGQLVGAEALARWTHPRLGQISPALFVPVAEATGLIGQVGHFVLHAACAMGAKWPGHTFAVNISPVQLRDPAFPASVFALLAQTGMRHDDLELEITEGILLEEGSIATEAIRLFRASGIKIALDDFGTGYSSLNYLKRYPVDRIKIDRSFVSQLAPGSVSVAIVQAMVTLAHALNIEVTAEGVETSEQMKILSNLHCNIFQGFLLSTPVTPALLEKLLAQPQVRVA